MITNTSPAENARFRAFLADTLYYAKTTQRAVPFRALLQHFAKNHCLTRTCAVLESSLYKRTP